jgi:hypothetical protein
MVGARRGAVVCHQASGHAAGQAVGAEVGVLTDRLLGLVGGEERMRLAECYSRGRWPAASDANTISIVTGNPQDRN